ncbi:dehydration-responsive element-binding protein 1C-like [Papaver somniferum]|uniref:dehydration-responsive element-binding protein 1C-like n=1 Tax=Papaver somniferum TaxID=3469 RepID=UPI000E703093|nr:dehydration-responsive element-binding protein 1C-like [Papaver somniferum]
MNFEQYYNEYSVSSSSQSSSSTDQNCSSESNETSSSSSSTRQLVSSHKKTSGRKKFKETRHPIYRGVRARKNDKWVCEVREPNSKSRIWLGTHSSAEIAARAYDVAAIALRGKSAPLNFEDSLWLLPRPKSSSAKDIQIAAAEVVRAFPFPSCTKPSSIRKKSFKSVTSKSPEETVEVAEKVLATFFDEEALYNMPALIASMAEGMLLDPPVEGYYYDDEVESNVDSSLWSDY